MWFACLDFTHSMKIFAIQEEKTQIYELPFNLENSSRASPLEKTPPSKQTNISGLETIYFT